MNTLIKFLKKSNIPFEKLDDLDLMVIQEIDTHKLDNYRDTLSTHHSPTADCVGGIIIGPLTVLFNKAKAITAITYDTVGGNLQVVPIHPTKLKRKARKKDDN
jgi:hypothetical protein